jgi:hypothetical protein
MVVGQAGLVWECALLYVEEERKIVLEFAIIRHQVMGAPHVQGQQKIAFHVLKNPVLTVSGQSGQTGDCVLPPVAEELRSGFAAVMLLPLGRGELRAQGNLKKNNPVEGNHVLLL